MTTQAERLILIAYWSKVASDKAGSPTDLMKAVDRAAEILAEYRRIAANPP